MKNIFKQQSQFELFPGAPGAKPKKAKSHIFGGSLTLSFENIISLGIVFLMGMIVAFSFGVERGKKSALVASHENIVEQYSIKDIAVAEEAIAEQIVEIKDVEEVKIAQIEENIGVFEKKVDKTPTLEKIHTIQVASFKQNSMAELEAERLVKRGYDAFFVQKGSYYIVCVGQFEERREAAPLLRALKNKYSDCYIRSL